MQIVNFSSNSKFTLIESYAFAECLIENITIPSNVTEICDRAFLGCKKLKVVNFQDNSNLRLIGDHSFCASSIESIIIPPHVTIIGSNAFSSCEKLQTVLFADNSELIKEHQIDHSKLN